MSLIGGYDRNQSTGSLECSSQIGYNSLRLLAFAEEISRWGCDVTVNQGDILRCGVLIGCSEGSEDSRTFCALRR